MQKFKTVSASGAIYKCESFQVVAYNKDGSQSRLYSAGSLGDLLTGYAKVIERMMKHPATVGVMKSYTKIFVWNVDDGFTGLELPFIETV
jgi:hypothetical protein